MNQAVGGSSAPIGGAPASGPWQVADFPTPDTPLLTQAGDEVSLAVEIDGSRNALALVRPDGQVVDTVNVEPVETVPQLWERLEESLEVAGRRMARHSVRAVCSGVSIGSGAGELAGASSADLFREAEALVGHSVDAPVFVDDVGRGFTLAERWVGAVEGLDNFAAIYLGHRVSGGIVLNGRLLDGALGHAGRVGHLIVNPEGRRCRCGGKGCLDTEASVGAIEGRTGRVLSEPSYDLMHQVGRMVGRAAASLANLLDLKVVVCGGPVAREYASTLFNAAQSEMDTACQMAFSRGARFTSAKSPEPAGALGAAAIGWHGYVRRHGHTGFDGLTHPGAATGER